jgi:DNA (cytosine-5)-methyltransferase 1
VNVLDLFSGIGGFSLGLERAGMRTVAFCELDPYCRRVLAKHWPDVPIFPDIRTLHGSDLPGPVDVVCGGFPCQDISLAGRGAGINGERSGLWTEFARIVGEVRPRYVLVENVAALLGRGMGRVLGDLAEIGYDAEWHCIPASAVGAPHRRDRVWIVAHPDGGCLRGEHPDSANGGAIQAQSEQRVVRGSRGGKGVVAAEYGRNRSAPDGVWFSESGIRRVVDGIPYRVDRLRALGNSLVPQIAELIGRAILVEADSA